MALYGGLDKANHLSEFNTPLKTASGIKTPAQRKALALAGLGLTATAAQINALGSGTSGFVEVADATPYTVLAANSGKLHIIREQTGNLTLNLPVWAAGLEFEFIPGGVANEAQNWIFVATTPSFWNGGVVWLDQDSATDNIEPVYGNGTSHLTFTAVAPMAGTRIRAFATTGGEWLIAGSVTAIATPTMA